MRIIIAGGRDYKQTHDDWVKIIGILRDSQCTEVVSGACSGADKFGERLAVALDLPIHEFPARWNEYGGKAGPMRNSEMAMNADACILMPGGAGTADMRRKAIACGLKILYDAGQS